MHVKLVVNAFPIASETFLFNLVTGLEKQGVKVTVCATRKSEDLSLYTHRLHEWSGNIQYISKQRASINKVLQQLSLVKSNPTSLIRYLLKKGFRKGWSHFAVVKKLLKGDPDIIHFAFSSIAIRYLDIWDDVPKSVKTVVSCRGTAENIKPLIEPEVNEQLREVLFKANMVHCVSAEMKRRLMAFGLTEQKSFINYPSIQIGRFSKNGRLPLQSATMCIVSVGRLTFQKGYAYALQALKILSDNNISFTYHIVGDGDERSMITYLIDEMGLNESVVMYGKAGSDKVIEVLKTADVFLLPSLSEGVSNAVLEAMAMELPVVSTTAGGMTEVIKHKENGLLTDWRDPQHMADQLMWLQQNPCRAIEMGAKARLTIENMFSLDRQIDIFVSQYKKLCNT